MPIIIHYMSNIQSTAQWVYGDNWLKALLIYNSCFSILFLLVCRHDGDFLKETKFLVFASSLFDYLAVCFKC